MRQDVHPNYQTIKVVCSCGNQFETKSTIKNELMIEICSECHPFYTGNQKVIDSAGRVEKFNTRYNRFSQGSKSKDA
jgi:large subunit ribosomal protein L31